MNNFPGARPLWAEPLLTRIFEKRNSRLVRIICADCVSIEAPFHSSQKPFASLPDRFLRLSRRLFETHQNHLTGLNYNPNERKILDNPSWKRTRRTTEVII